MATLSRLALFAALSLVALVAVTSSVAAAETGTITVTVQVAPDPSMVGRTWRFEVSDAAGNVASTIEVQTTLEQLAASTSTLPLARGQYAVRQLIGSDTALSCDSGDTYFVVSAPAGAVATVDLSGSSAAATFSIAMCPDRPKLTYLAPVDPIEPAGQINEVRGIRAPGVLPPATGSGAAPVDTNAFAVIGLVFIGLSAVPGLAFAFERRP